MKDTFLTRTLLCLMLLCSGRLYSDGSNLEYKIKAAYLYNFTKFITWPEIKGTDFNICLLGNDPFGSLIDPIEEKSAFAKSIKVIRLVEADFLSNSNSNPGCHILYVSTADNPKTAVDKVKGLPNKLGTLIVGEGEDFVTAGGMIGFVNRDGKIKLQINLQSARQSGLKISAKLLEIAELVEEDKS